MGCPYHYEEPVRRPGKSRYTLGVLLGALAIGATVIALTKKSSSEGADAPKLFEKQKTPNQYIGQEFYMPHFMLKNFHVTPNETGVSVRIDYTIDDILYNHLMHNTPHYTFRFTLPEEYRQSFEGDGTAEVIGDLVYGTGDRKDYAVTFDFKQREDADKNTAAKLNERTGKYKLDIVDNQLKVLNNFDDVYGAVNIIRF
ncbi:hypothetical protein ERX35_006865 [Macrococcus equipercicus]|uniref:DUF4179 domain-containing protein n=1 Tax=Macrococcus equipercicus TaxID=69967 RepID=A0ABQ6R841_9STAP|nr:hypothetical protein [Macrococcus equipercicus]KAA1039287.1 hypothetical protein ERX35_006865 [Macrococcus equipercicus]